MKIFFILCCSLLMTCASYAAPNLTGYWQQIDDITGTPRSVIEIFKDYDGSYAGKLIQVGSQSSYLPRKNCHNCPSPYTNQPIIGLKWLSRLQLKNAFHYDAGKVIDPMTGRMYDAYLKVDHSGNAFTLHTYMGFAFLGRSQTWLRINKDAT